MATVEECERALVALAERLAGVDPALRRRHSVDRTIACQVPDLQVTFSGRLVDGTLVDVTRGDAPAAQLRLSVRSDDLLAITAGSLGFAAAWATGKLKIDASVLDLVRLRTLL